MSAEKQNPIKNSVVATLVSGALVGLIAYLVPGGWGWVVGQFRSILTHICNWLISTAIVPVWVIFLLSILVLIFVIIMAAHAWSAIFSKGDVAMDYTSDEFLGIKWRWQYGMRGIYGITPYCPQCDLQVHPSNVSMYESVPRIVYCCEDCGWKSEEFSRDVLIVENLVERKIQQRLRSKIDCRA